MRYHAIAITVLLMLATTVHGEITAVLSNNRIYLGETVVLRVKQAGTLVHDPATPVDGIRWLEPAGVRDREDLNLSFMATRVGNVDLGMMVFRDADNQSVSVKFPQVTVIDNGIGDDVALEFRSPLSKAHIGQAVPVSIRLLVSAQLVLKAEQRLPTLAVDDATWRHHLTNTTDRRLRVTTGSTTVGGKSYRFWRYDGILFPQADGPMAGHAKMAVNVILTPSRRPNPFWEELMGSERRLVTIERRIRLSPITVKPVPVPPDGVHDLGLIGDFKTTLTATPPSIPLDGDVTIRFTARGDGNVELCRTPVLSLPGWTCFNPQKRVDLKAGIVTLEWILQPTGHAFPIKDLVIGHYSPTQTRWITTPLADTVVVEGGKGSGTPPLPLLVEDGVAFMRSTPIAGLALAWAAAPAVALIVLILLAWRKPLRIRRFDHRRRRLIAALSQADESELPELLSGDLLAALRELCQVTPGTAFREFKDRLGDDAFAKVLEESLETSYKPEPEQRTVTDVISGLKRFRPPMIVLLLLALCGGFAEESPEEAYARFDFVSAERGFEARVSSNPTVATMLNLGQCRYLNQEFAGALLCAERVLRVDPRNTVALDLRYQCRKKLDLLTEGRDTELRLRPVELSLIGAALWTVGWLIFIPLTFWRSRKAFGLALVLIICGSAVGIAAWGRAWSPDRLMVIRETPLYAIAAEGEASDVTLSVSATVTLLEEADGWARVQVGKHSGWVPRTAVGRVVPASGKKTFTTY